MIWGFVFMFSCLILIGILFVPFYFEIDSIQNSVILRYNHILYLSLIFIGNYPVMKLTIGGWSRHFKVLQFQPQKNKDQVPQHTKRRRLSFHKLRSLLKTFTITKFKLHFDLANNEWNGLLFPLCLWIAYRYQLDLRVNFKQENVFQIQLKNNMAHLLWAYLFK